MLPSRPWTHSAGPDLLRTLTTCGNSLALPGIGSALIWQMLLVSDSPPRSRITWRMSHRWQLSWLRSYSGSRSRHSVLPVSSVGKLVTSHYRRCSVCREHSLPPRCYQDKLLDRALTWVS